MEILKTQHPSPFNCLLSFNGLDSERAYLTDTCGFIVNKDRALSLIYALYNFYSNTDNAEIEINNKLKGIEFEKSIRHTSKSQKTRSLKHISGHVYIFSCCDKYKIGYSKNVEQRIRQLNNRPFEVTLIYSKYFTYARDIEQWLHKETDLFHDKIDGEWYNFSEQTLQNIIDWLEQLTDDDWRSEHGNI